MSIDNRSTTLLIEHTADKVAGVVTAMKVSGRHSHHVVWAALVRWLQDSASFASFSNGGL